MSTTRKWQVVARNKSTNNVRQVYRDGDGFTRRRPRDGAGINMSQGEAADCVKWGAKRGLVVFATKSPYPFLVLDTDTAWGNPNLSEKLNELGRKQMRYVWVGEFKRTAYQQWVFRMAYLKGYGNLAARCCSKYSGIHSWENCGRDSWSNHAPGNAADSSILHCGRGGSFTNLGDWGHGIRDNMRALDTCLPVPRETWHAERGNTWRA